MKDNGHHPIRDFLVQATSVTSETALDALALSMGLPAGLAFNVVKAVATGWVQGVVADSYDDVIQKKLSTIEVNKLMQVSDIALRTYLELAANDNIATLYLVPDGSEMRYAFEVAEHTCLEAIKQSEMAKVEVLGRFQGKQFYEGRMNWQDMHQMITMAGSLSLRQLILIRLISERFDGYTQDLYITNPSACVEIRQLLNFGIWQINGAPFSTNNARSLQLSFLTPTEYASQVSTALMLERLSDDDIKRTIDSLHLSDVGEAFPLLTEDQYKDSTEWHYDESEQSLNLGTYDN